ncbi:hypothetical protein B7494_g1614 [Chlorociboria aeruginascens]|nr:hypothetical protein B7494_g1614 [Chlorociboria aeruginascens]
MGMRQIIDQLVDFHKWGDALGRDRRVKIFGASDPQLNTVKILLDDIHINIRIVRSTYERIQLILATSSGLKDQYSGGKTLVHFNMAGFQPSLASSPPPSTPDKRSQNGRTSFPFGTSNPSTTPAGPPPSSTGTFTPAGPPPSSYLGSSILGTQVKPLSFGRQGSFQSSQFKHDSPRSSTKFQRGSQSPSDESEEDDEVLGYSEQIQRYNEEQQYDEEVSGEDVPYEPDEDMEYSESEMPMVDPRTGIPYDQASNSDLLLSTAGGLRQSTEGIMRDSMGISLSGQDRVSIYNKIAKDMTHQMGIPPIDESPDLILGTDAIITRLYDEGFGPVDDDELLRQALSTIPAELLKLWDAYDKKTAVYNSEEYAAAIGPGPKASGFAKANFLAGLTLRIHHPKLDENKPFGNTPKPLPQIMLEWMDEHHDPYPSQLEEIQSHRPSPANHHLFWASILNGLLRGKVVAVVNILKNAGWRYAWAGLDDIRDKSSKTGYTGVALTNIERVISAATDVLSQCPAIRGNWDIRGSDWTLFRLRISQCLEDLKRFAEGKDRSHGDILTSGRESIVSGRDGTFSQTAKKAESKVPWHIYQNLLTLYSLVLGESNAIIENAQDWCEATVGLLVWWDDGKDDRRLAVRRSQSTRFSSRTTDSEAYQRKLRRSFELATTQSTDFQVNTNDPVEVGLASLLEEDNEGVVWFLRAWSGPVSSAVAEVASLGGWLPHAEPQSLINMGSLDQEDLDLLGMSSSPAKIDSIKDQTLIRYARSLLERRQLRALLGTGRQEITREGWELSIAVLGRLDSAQRSEEMIKTFLDDFVLDSSATVDKLWRLLGDLSMPRLAEDTANSYAEILAEDSHKYGEALWYYSLAHKPEKVRDVLNLLISYSLIHSIAYPPESELDPHLKRLISSSKSALTEMATLDVEAAELLQKMLSGYATLRKFYNLRDEEVLSKDQKPQMGAIARKAAAASALLAVITSSDDNIRGGLYDEERDAVVSVDFLLALLGEAMVFVNQSNFKITAEQIDILLKAIEDLQAVGFRITSACDEFLKTVIASAPGLRGSSPADMLRKSASNISGTSSFSLMASSMMASQLQRSIGSSGVLVKGDIRRGWDWRQAVSAGTTGDDILRILRLGLAKDLAKAWLIEADSRLYWIGEDQDNRKRGLATTNCKVTKAESQRENMARKRSTPPESDDGRAGEPMKKKRCIEQTFPETPPPDSSIGPDLTWPQLFDDEAQELLKRSIAQALEYVGFDGATPEAMESFCASVESYASHFLSPVCSSMLNARRAQPIPPDFQYALRQFDLPLASLVPHLKPPVSSPPLNLQVEFPPPRPLEPKDLEGLLGPELSGAPLKESKSYIPKQFPAFPSLHTFKWTPKEVARETDPKKIRELAVIDARHAEEALRRLGKVGQAARERAIKKAADRDPRTRETRRLWEDMMENLKSNSAPNILDKHEDQSMIVNAEKKYWRKGAPRRRVSVALVPADS